MSVEPMAPEEEGYCRLARLKIYDKRYQVLHKHNLVVTEVYAYQVERLQTLLAVYARRAMLMENEPMSLPRMVVWCPHHHREVTEVFL